MHAWEQIQIAVDFIEENIDKEISIGELADKAGLSQFYFQRLFHRLVKKPVAEYIRLRRMSRALDELPDKNKRILDIALELGFSTHEHFTRTFKNTYGMTPDEYRHNPKVFNRMLKPELLLNYVLVDEGVPLITEGIVIEINRRQFEKDNIYTGFKHKLSFDYGANLGNEPGEDVLWNLWESVHDYKQRMGKEGKVISPEEIGVTLPCSELGFYNYFAGAHIDVDTSAPCDLAVPDGLEQWTLPSGEYLTCVFEAENFETLVMDALYKAIKYIYSTWLPNHKLQTEMFSAEYYETHGAGTTKMEMLMKIKE